MNTTNLNIYQKDLHDLIDKGHKMQIGFLEELNQLDQLQDKEDILNRIGKISFLNNYENWYTESLSVINQFIPNRAKDFVYLYKNNDRKEIDYLTYTISDYLIGVVTKKGDSILADGKAAFPKFQNQLRILISANERFSSSLIEIKQMIQADLLDNEIESAKELYVERFFRSAGAVCGVIIEKHLEQVLRSRDIDLAKINSSIHDCNVVLRDNNVINLVLWRFIERMSDIRNFCVHTNDREPTKDEIEELILGTERIIKTVY